MCPSTEKKQENTISKNIKQEVFALIESNHATGQAKQDWVRMPY